ncbi:MAG: EAL domain-containing protein, partial [Alcaligenaceae bacterium]|nr:EAL domain-containing protein [Alcaligenaceae bacterium]
LSNKAFDRLEWINKLRNALANNEFLLHYQPKIEVLSGRIVGAEALLRWRTSDGSMISPADFIPLAEEVGLIVPIGEWVLREACRMNRSWQNAGYRPIPIAVNISAIQLERDDLVDKVMHVLEETGLTPHYLEVEITESALMGDVNQSIHTLQRLRKLGVRSAIDDFGTGYSSLAHLKRFAVDTLKIDRSFISNITQDRGNIGIVQAIISLAHTLGLTVVAEGVETPEEYRHLGARGCDQIQGYYSGRPMTAEALAEKLRAQR